ncbi:MAG TPA: helix-turn-helix domain-containing protein [Streptosporangiaceae bacterium]|jgi:AcrR family transcriptional regulator
MAGRRSDTKERIQQVALELFAERGYDKTSLKDVAARLEITRPALYYHFKTKEDILNGVVADLGSSLNELTEWAVRQPKTPAARREVLTRLSGLFTDQWVPLMRFAQVNQAAMDELPIGAEMRERMLGLLAVLDDPGAAPEKRFELRLAVITVMISGVPMLFEDIPMDDRTAVAMAVAEKLIA